jgi:hypothetical protein
MKLFFLAFWIAIFLRDKPARKALHGVFRNTNKGESTRRTSHSGDTAGREDRGCLPVPACMIYGPETTKSIIR